MMLLSRLSTGKAVQKSAFQPTNQPIGLLVHAANEQIFAQTFFLSVQKHVRSTARKSADVGLSAAAALRCVPC